MTSLLHGSHRIELVFLAGRAHRMSYWTDCRVWDVESTNNTQANMMCAELAGTTRSTNVREGGWCGEPAKQTRAASWGTRKCEPSLCLNQEAN